MKKTLKNIGVIIVFLVAVISFTLIGIYYTLPDVSSLRYENPSWTAMMDFQEKKALKLKKKYEIFYHFIPLSKIPQNLKDAVILSEDVDFYRHNGFSWKELSTTFTNNLRDRKWVRGSSSISQQLAKNLFLHPQKTFQRKFIEAVLTFKLENALSKDRILELYLNIIEWGHGTYGVEAAANYYYHKPASDLNLEESIRLASILPNPNRFNPHINFPEKMVKRRLIIARMFYSRHMIDEVTWKAVAQEFYKKIDKAK